jgi:hypothetical protein
VYEALNNKPKMLEYYQRALDFVTKHGLSYHRFTYLKRMADIYESIGDKNKAEELRGQAKEVFRQP